MEERGSKKDTLPMAMPRVRRAEKEGLRLRPTSREYTRAVAEWVWQCQAHYFSHNNSNFMGCSGPAVSNIRSDASAANGNLVSNVTSNSPENVNPIYPINPPLLPFIPQPQQAQINVEPVGHEYTVPSLHRRLLAEFIDFLFLFTIKLVVSVFIIEYFGISDTANFMMKFLVEELDEEATMEDLQQMLVMALLYRLFVCTYETIFIKMSVRGRIGGATPGKYFMGLRVVTCDRTQNIGGNKVMIYPAGNVSFTQSFLRAFIKNFSMAFFFPVCITVFFNTHFRAAYDVICRTMVVSDPNWPQVLRRQRRR